MKDQYEQKCNAEALKAFGVSVVPKINRSFFEHLQRWMDEGPRIQADFPHHTDAIIDQLILKGDTAKDYQPEDAFRLAI